MDTTPRGGATGGDDEPFFTAVHDNTDATGNTGQFAGARQHSLSELLGNSAAFLGIRSPEQSGITGVQRAQRGADIAHMAAKLKTTSVGKTVRVSMGGVGGSGTVVYIRAK